MPVSCPAQVHGVSATQRLARSKNASRRSWDVKLRSGACSRSSEVLNSQTRRSLCSKVAGSLWLGAPWAQLRLRSQTPSSPSITSPTSHQEPIGLPFFFAERKLTLYPESWVTPAPEPANPKREILITLANPSKDEHIASGCKALGCLFPMAPCRGPANPAKLCQKRRWESPPVLGSNGASQPQAASGSHATDPGGLCKGSQNGTTGCTGQGVFRA